MRHHSVHTFLLGVLTVGAAARAPAQPSPGTRTPAPIPLPPVAELDGTAQSVWGWDAGQPPAAFRCGDGALQATLCGPRACDVQLAELEPDGARARLRCELRCADAPVALPHARIRRIRATDVFVAEQSLAAGPCLCVVSWLHDGALWQLLELHNGGDTTLRDAQLLVRVEAERGSCRIGAPDATAAATAWNWRAGDLPPRGHAITALLVRCDTAVAVPRDLLAAARRQLGEALQRWRTEARLVVEADEPELVDFLHDAVASLDAWHLRGIGPVDPARGSFRVADATGPLLAWLRCGLLERARAILATEFAGAAALGNVDAVLPVRTLRAAPATGADAAFCAPRSIDVEAACWVVLHHAWYLRATHDPAPIRAHWPLLATCAEHAAAAATASPSFAATVLCVHAVASAGGLLDGIDRIEHSAAWRDGPPAARPGAAWTQRSLRLLAAMEQRFWCEAAGRFSARPVADGAPLPPIEARANLLPCWIGWLATTGDKTARNVAATLAELGRDGVRVVDAGGSARTSALAQALAVAALVQFEAAERSAALAQLLASADAAATFATPDGTDLLATGAAVDAVLFALTGLRLATGPGLDEDWLRLRPSLPAGVRAFACRGLAIDGCLADLWVDEVRGPPTADELAADPGADGRLPRTRFALVLHAPRKGARLVVVHLQGRQFQAWLHAEEPLQRTATVDAGRRWLGRG